MIYSSFLPEWLSVNQWFANWMNHTDRDDFQYFSATNRIKMTFIDNISELRFHLFFNQSTKSHTKSNSKLHNRKYYYRLNTYKKLPVGDRWSSTSGFLLIFILFINWVHITLISAIYFTLTIFIEQFQSIYFITGKLAMQVSHANVRQASKAKNVNYQRNQVVSINR